MKNISIKLNEYEYRTLKDFAKKNRKSMSRILKDAFFEKLEDEYDIKLFDNAYAEYKRNPKTYTIDEVFKELDL